MERSYDAAERAASYRLIWEEAEAAVAAAVAVLGAAGFPAADLEAAEAPVYREAGDLPRAGQARIL